MFTGSLRGDEEFPPAGPSGAGLRQTVAHSHSITLLLLLQILSGCFSPSRWFNSDRNLNTPGAATASLMQVRLKV